MANIAGTTVVLADSHAIVREGFAALCEQQGMRVVGQCADGPSAMATILAEQPDFVILDLPLLESAGAEVIRALRSANCQAKILVLSLNREEKVLLEAFRGGADAYLLKDGPARHLIEALRYVREGGQYVSPLLPVDWRVISMFYWGR